MLGYMTSKGENWESGEWIPAHWQQSEQVGALDRAITIFKTWISDMKGLGEELRHAQSHEYRDYGYSDERGDQYPGGRVAYEDASPVDFDTSLITDPYSYLDQAGLDSEDFILYEFPDPHSGTLEKLQQDFYDTFNEYLFMLEADWSDVEREWINLDEDPAVGASAAGDAVFDVASEAERDGLSQLLDIRTQWVNEVHRLEAQEHDTHVEKAYAGGAYASVDYAEDVLALSEEAIDELEAATSTRADEEIKQYLDELSQKADEASEIPGMLTDDVSFMEGAVDDIKQIASRTHHSDIRSWEARDIQKSDALIAVDRVRSHWAKRLEDFQDLDHVKKINRLASKAGNGTLPSYRFKVGQMVKVSQSRRYGKVIGAKLEGGTGKQVYEVRVNGLDSPKTFYSDELERSE